MGLLGTAHSAAEIAELNQRTKRLIPYCRAQIEQEGGTLERAYPLNSRLIWRSPFPQKLIRINSIGGRPVLLRLRCKYPNDTGWWFVYCRAESDPEWTWMSNAGKAELPVARGDGSKVKSGVVVFPFWFGAFLYLALVSLLMFIVFKFFLLPVPRR